MARTFTLEHVSGQRTLRSAHRHAQRVGAGAAAERAGASGCLCHIGLRTCVFGFLFNRAYTVWDYRGLPHSFRGQICPQYFCAWLFIALLAVFLDDGLRVLALGESLPHYSLF